MSLSDLLSTAALIISLLAIGISFRADRREREKHQADMETTWKAELFEEPALGRAEIRFRCTGPKHIHKAWIDQEIILRQIRPLPVTVLMSGYSMHDGEYLTMYVTDLSRITDLPDDIPVHWYYETGRLARASVRIRRLFAPLDFADERHIHNVSLTSVKTEYLERQQAREQQARQQKQ